YKAVWSKIKATEKNLNASIVYADKKDGTHLTPEGKELMKKYRLLVKECRSVDNKIFNSIFNQNDHDVQTYSRADGCGLPPEE
ncbi:MAG: hypothetical protein KKH68_11220, partial [Proteobacteria bacterium]|nr:hypothetical protein [Pseudomonadota bacterium]